MAKIGLAALPVRWAASRAVRWSWLLSAGLILSGCASWNIPREVRIPDKARLTVPTQPFPQQLLPTPELLPVHEDITPLKTTRVDLSARNTPLRDVLYTVAQATSLNLVMEKDVNPEVPVTLSLTDVSAEDALKTIFSSVDYFYAIKNNLLIVRATETRTFELGFPAVLQQYQTELGGDIVGAGEVSGGGGGGGSSSGGTGGGGGTTTALKGSVSQKSEGDKKAFDFWDVIDNSIKTILSKSPEQSYMINKLASTIVVTASKQNLERVEQYLDLVRKVINRQVLVEAKIIEVTLTDNLQFGLDWNAVIQKSGVGTINLGTKNFARVVPAVSPAFTIATTGADFVSTLNTIQELGEVRVLSNPRISIMNGQTSLLCVGRKQSFISKTETTFNAAAAGTLGTTTFTVETSSVLSGIIIGIVPYVSENGEISLTITPITSDLVQLSTRQFGGVGSNQVEIDLPTVDIRELSTTVKVRNGQLVILGGLIASKESITDNQVPVFGDIPVLGTLFKSRNKTAQKTELVVLLQPTIVSN
jgi:MSHA type pilus biogenesis protein MshL